MLAKQEFVRLIGTYDTTDLSAVKTASSVLAVVSNNVNGINQYTAVNNKLYLVVNTVMSNSNNSDQISIQFLNSKLSWLN